MESDLRFIGDELLYRVYRRKNRYAADHSGNREYACGHMETRVICDRVAEYLNMDETSGEWRTDDLTIEQRKAVSAIIHYYNTNYES